MDHEQTLRDLQCAQYNILYHEREIAHHEAAREREVERLRVLERKWKDGRRPQEAPIVNDVNAFTYLTLL